MEVVHQHLELQMINIEWHRDRLEKELVDRCFQTSRKTLKEQDRVRKELEWRALLMGIMSLSCSLPLLA